MLRYLQYDITYNTTVLTIQQLLTILHYLQYYSTCKKYNYLQYYGTTLLSILHYLQYYITYSTTFLTILTCPSFLFIINNPLLLALFSEKTKVLQKDTYNILKLLKLYLLYLNKKKEIFE